MDFNLSEQHTMLASTIYHFMDREIEPIIKQIDIEDKMPDWIWRRFGELGWLGITIPEKYGGAGSDYLAQTICIEEVSRIWPGLGISLIAHSNLCADNLCRNGTDAQKEMYLPALCSGENVGALGLTEPDAGSDAVSLKTTARADGDFYALNGNKMFITNGTIADTLVVYAKTDPERGAKGMAAFIVRRGFQGSFISNKIEKMGNRGSPTAELSFEDYMVPRDNLLGVENEGIRVLMSGLDRERVVYAGCSLGIVRRALELSVKYARERVQFGQPIGQFQLIQGKLADMYVMVEASRLMTYKAAILASESEGGGKGTEIHKLAAAALLYSGESATKAASETVQIHGGYGYTLDSPANMLYRDAKLCEIGAGTSEIRRLIIAEALL